MAIIDSDDPTLSKLLRDHVKLLEATEGWVNPELIIRSTEGEISLAHAGEITPETRLVWVPSTALISIEQGVLSRRRDDIIPGDEASKLQPLELKILEVQCDIFNVTGKLAKARKRLPRFALGSAPELLDSLVSRRVHPEVETHPCTDAQPPDQRGDPLAEFLETRLLQPQKTGAPENILMSLIDYLNHHGQADRYHFSPNDGSLFTVPWRSNDRGDECFVRYTDSDAHGFLLNYGFIDTSATFARAASFEIIIEDLGIIRVIGGRHKRQTRAEVGTAPGETMPAPELNILPDGELQLSNIAISGRAEIPTLRRNLAIALITWKRDLPQETMTRMVDMLESEIVHRTLAYYEQLAGMAARYSDIPASAEVVRLADFQREILREYQLGSSRKQPS